MGLLKFRERMGGVGLGVQIWGFRSGIWIWIWIWGWLGYWLKWVAHDMQIGEGQTTCLRAWTSQVRPRYARTSGWTSMGLPSWWRPGWILSCAKKGKHQPGRAVLISAPDLSPASQQRQCRPPFANAQAGRTLAPPQVMLCCICCHRRQPLGCSYAENIRALLIDYPDLQRPLQSLGWTCGLVTAPGPWGKGADTLCSVSSPTSTLIWYVGRSHLSTQGPKELICSDTSGLLHASGCHARSHPR